MIRLATALLTLNVITATATTAIAVEPQGWCYCNPEAPACRSPCPAPPLVMEEQGRTPSLLSAFLPTGWRGNNLAIKCVRRP